MGSGPGLGTWGVLQKRRGSCPGLLLGIPFLLLLDWSAFKPGPVEGFVFFRAPCLGAEGLPLVVRVGVVKERVRLSAIDMRMSYFLKQDFWLRAFKMRASVRFLPWCRVRLCESNSFGGIRVRVAWLHHL
jgi:hypothetical protein